MPFRSLVPAAFPLVVVLSSFHSSALAQEPATADTARLGDLVVTASRAEEPRRNAPATVTAVTGAELRERGIRFVIDWLREVPGAAVVPTGSFGGVTSLFLRGGESDYTKVLIDGVPVNLPGGSVDLAHLTTDNVERIEVLRGPASVLYGSDAVTGVIHILTRRGTSPASLNARARAGTFGTTDFQGGASGGSDAAAWSGTVSRFSSDGFYPFNNGYRSWVASGRLGVRLDRRSDVALAVRGGDHRSHFPTDFAGVPTDSNQFTSEKGLTVGLDAGHRLNPRLELRLAGSIYRAEQGYRNLSDSPGDTLGFGYAGTRDSRLGRQTLDLRAVLTPGHAVHLTGGVEAGSESERQRSATTSNFGGGAFREESEFDRDRSNLAAWLQSRFGLPGGLDLHLGLRHDDNEVFGSFTTWRGGVVYLPSLSWRFHAAAGTAFKQPAFSEQFADTPFEVGDPDLRPERNRTWEAGVEWTPLGGLGLRATGFDQRFRDLIQYRSAAEGEPTYANIARAAARGVELGLTVRPLDPIRLGVHGTWLDTEVLETGSPGPSFQVGERLLRRPAFTLAATAGWSGPRGLRLDGEIIRTGSRDDVDFTTFPAERMELDGFTLVAVSTDLPLTILSGGADLALTLRADNLFDTEYQTVVGFPGRGRTILIGLRYGR